MDIDSLIVFDDDDFPEGLVEELNSSYEESRFSSRADDEPTRPVESTQDARSSSNSQANFEARSVPSSSGQTLYARLGGSSSLPRTRHSGGARPVLTSPRSFSAPRAGQRSVFSRSSPEAAVDASTDTLPRRDLYGNRSPFNEPPLLSGEDSGRASSHGRAAKAARGAEGAGGAEDAGDARGAGGARGASVPEGLCGLENAGGGVPAAPVDGHHTTGAAEARDRAGHGVAGLPPSPTQSPVGKKDLRDHYSRQRRNGREGFLTHWLILILAMGSAVALGVMIHLQNMQRQAATSALEIKIAELHELVESYQHSEIELMRHESAKQESNQSILPQSPSPSNLALLSKGAHILSGYTTPPALSNWWLWSPTFRVDHNCMLRPPSNECWPIRREATVAIGLGQAANLQKVSFDFAGKREPFNFDAFLIDDSGAIDRLQHEKSDQDFDLIDAAKVTQLMLRLSAFGDLCIRNVEIIGYVD